MCANTTCTYDGEGRNVGYTIPTVDDMDAAARRASRSRA